MFNYFHIICDFMLSIPVLVTVDKVDLNTENALSRYVKITNRWENFNMYAGDIELQGNTPKERKTFYTKIILDILKEPCVRTVEKSVYLETLGD